MKKIRELTIALSSLIVIFVITLVLFSFYLTKKTESQIKMLLPAVEKKEEIADVPEDRKIRPSRPEDYGVVIFHEGETPRLQSEWNEIIGGKIKELKHNLAPETWQKIQEQIAEDPQKTEEKLQQIDEKLAELKSKLVKEPDNQEIKDRINRLMILKSVARDLS